MGSAAFVKAQSEFPAIAKATGVDTGKVLVQLCGPPRHSRRGAATPSKTNGLAVAQSVAGDEHTIAVETRIYHSSGWTESFGPLVLAAPGGAQAAGSAITYARRYALCAALGIAPDEDDDGAKASKAEKPVKVEPEVSGNDWLAVAVEVFGLWTPEAKKKMGASVMKNLGFKNPLTLDQAKAVKKEMDSAYVAEFPTQAGELPF